LYISVTLQSPKRMSVLPIGHFALHLYFNDRQIERVEITSRIHLYITTTCDATGRCVRTSNKPSDGSAKSAWRIRQNETNWVYSFSWFRL